MTKVLIVSDSHGLEEELEKIKKMDDFTAMLHCGDSELDIDAIEMDGYYKVQGNTDFDTRYPKEQTLEIDGMSFYMTHGHLYDVKMDLTPLSYRAEEKKARIACYGHSHIAKVDRVNDLVLINPGSIRQPRGRKEKTFAVIEYDDLSQIQIRFYDLNGKEVEDMASEIKF